MQHYLASQQAIDIPIKHLYAEYRHWIEKKVPFSTVENELRSLREYRNHFRDLLEIREDVPYTDVARALAAFDIGTAYPLMLHLLASDCEVDELSRICTLIESYIVRRAIGGLTNKNLNRVFLTLVRNLQAKSISLETVRMYFLGLQGDSAEWPSDASFSAAWMNADAYRRMNSTRLCYILGRLNDTYSSSKTERIEIDGALSVEHIMPQSWQENWLLPSGADGMGDVELWEAEEDDARTVETRRRNQLVQTFGNLTVLTTALNSSVSNSAWSHKKVQMLKNSLLPINLMLADHDEWDDDAILRRGKELFERAVLIWPRS